MLFLFEVTTKNIICGFVCATSVTSLAMAASLFTFRLKFFSKFLICPKCGKICLKKFIKFHLIENFLQPILVIVIFNLQSWISNAESHILSNINCTLQKFLHLPFHWERVYEIPTFKFNLWLKQTQITATFTIPSTVYNTVDSTKKNKWKPQKKICQLTSSNEVKKKQRFGSSETYTCSRPPPKSNFSGGNLWPSIPIKFGFKSRSQSLNTCILFGVERIRLLYASNRSIRTRGTIWEYGFMAIFKLQIEESTQNSNKFGENKRNFFIQWKHTQCPFVAVRTVL